MASPSVQKKINLPGQTQRKKRQNPPHHPFPLLKRIGLFKRQTRKKHALTKTKHATHMRKRLQAECITSRPGPSALTFLPWKLVVPALPICVSPSFLSVVGVTVLSVLRASGVSVSLINLHGSWTFGRFASTLCTECPVGRDSHSHVDSCQCWIQLDKAVRVVFSSRHCIPTDLAAHCYLAPNHTTTHSIQRMSKGCKVLPVHGTECASGGAQPIPAHPFCWCPGFCAT